MYYEEHGVAKGRPLVLLHGFTSTGDFWRKQIDPFRAQYRLVVPNWRGHGRTDNPGGPEQMNHRQFAQDAIGLCNELRLVRPTFCGESSGAMQLLWLGVEAPDLPQALILSGGSHFYSDDLRAWWRGQSPESVASTEWRLSLQTSHTALGSEHWRTVVAAWIALGEHTHADDFPEKEALRDIRTPTLIVHGDRDHFFPVEVPLELYHLLPNAELCILPQTDHIPPNEHPEWFNPIVLDFLARRAT